MTHSNFTMFIFQGNGPTCLSQSLLEVMCCKVYTVYWKVNLRLCGCSFQSTDTSSTTDMKCEIRSSCFLSGCQHTDMTVDPDSNITHNCSISTGKHAQGMTWKQARQEVQNSTGLSDLMLLKSNSTKDSGNMTCYCTNINFIRRCFFGCSVVNGREWLWSVTKFWVIKICFLLRPWPSKKNNNNNNNRRLLLSKQLINWNISVPQFLHRVSEKNKWLCAVADL